MQKCIYSIQKDYITGMEFAVAEHPVEYYAGLTASISDNLEFRLEGINELVHYLYFQYGKKLKQKEQVENIRFDLIKPYKNVDFERYMYIAGQRTLLRIFRE